MQKSVSELDGTNNQQLTTNITSIFPLKMPMP